MPSLREQILSDVDSPIAALILKALFIDHTSERVTHTDATTGSNLNLRIYF